MWRYLGFNPGTFGTENSEWGSAPPFLLIKISTLLPCPWSNPKPLRATQWLCLCATSADAMVIICRDYFWALLYPQVLYSPIWTGSSVAWMGIHHLRSNFPDLISDSQRLLISSLPNQPLILNTFDSQGSIFPYHESRETERMSNKIKGKGKILKSSNRKE